MNPPPCPYSVRRHGVLFVCECRLHHRGDHQMWKAAEPKKEER